MNINNIAVTLRPRTGWQSIDLGFKLGRQWFLPLFLLWCTLSVPVYLLCKLAGLPGWLVLLSWWWFKPLYEAPLYFWCSRAVFAEPVTLKQSLAILPRKLFSLLSTYILFWRLGTTRSQNMSVIMIENLNRKDRSRRIAVISRFTKRTDPLIFVCVHIEVAIAYSLMLIGYLIVPNSLTEDALFLTMIGQAESFWLATALEVCTLIAAGVVAPFYVCSGFSLYINRRTHLEAWDIDLHFRRLIERQGNPQFLATDPTSELVNGQQSGPGPVHNGSVRHTSVNNALNNNSDQVEGQTSDKGQRPDRHSGGPSLAASLTGVFVLLCCVLQPNTSALANSTSAVPNDRESHLIINEILDHKDFGVTSTKLEARFVERTEEEEEDSFSLDWDIELWDWVEALIGFILRVSNVALWVEGVLWVMAALVFAGLVYLIITNSGHFSGIRRYFGFSRYPASQVQIFDLDIAPKSLPADIPSAARSLLKDGQQREAMSLLYRGALSRLVHRYGMEITDSATERQCVDLVDREQPAERKDVFKLLTRYWLQVAYGHSGVSDDQVSRLCDQWSPAFDTGMGQSGAVTANEVAS